MSTIIISIVYGSVLATIYALLYYFNHKTPAPRGYEHLFAQCKGCSILSCDRNNAYKIKED